MSTVGSVSPTGSQPSQPTSDQTTPVQSLGLPPAILAEAASINTINAELVSSQWGLDPAAVSGMYGGSAQSGGLFGNTDLLPLLTTLTQSTAEQALTLIGLKPVLPYGGATNSPSNATAASAQPADESSSANGVIIDPLWGARA
jgi:hypothetical protein